VWMAGRLTAHDWLWMSAAALAVMAGHAYPVFLKFKGGKAVASWVGAFLCLTPVALIAVLVVFVVVVAWTRYISMGSIIMAATLPLAIWLIVHPPLPPIMAAIIAGAFIIYKHSNNIQRRAPGESTSLVSGRVSRESLAIIGGGSWGTALAIILAPASRRSACGSTKPASPRECVRLAKTMSTCRVAGCPSRGSGQPTSRRAGRSGDRPERNPV